MMGLFVAVTAVLLHGTARRPTPDGSVATPVPTPLVSPPGLRADLEKTPLSYWSDYWLQLGSKVKAGLVHVGPRKTAGIVVGPHLAVSTIESADGEAGARWTTGSDVGASRLLAANALEGLALFELDSSHADVALRPANPSTLHPGMLVAAVTVDPDDRLEVMPGHLNSVGDPSLSGAAAALDSLDVSVPVGRSTRAAAIVDLDGNLVGAVFRSNGRKRLLSARSLLTTAERLRANPTCRSLEVADLREPVRRLLGLDAGVAVERIERGAFRPEPSVQAGDVLLEWNRQKIPNTAEFVQLYDAVQPGTLVPYVARRGRRELRGGTIMPGPDCRPLGEPPVFLPKAGLMLVWAPQPADGEPWSSAWRVTKVVPGSPAEAAGVQPGDRILGADRSGSNREEVLRAIGVFEKQGRPMVLAVQREDRVKLVPLTPAQG